MSSCGFVLRYVLDLALTLDSVVWMQRRPEIHLFAARYQEQLADIKGARASYEVLSNSLAPGLLEAIVKHANFEKRQVLIFDHRENSFYSAYS